MTRDHMPRGHLHAEAVNPETPTARLEELAAIPRLASLVAANPNASEETLLKLACDHPQSVLSNPIIPLLILEDPRFVTRFDGLSLLHFLKMESLPGWLLSSIAHRTDDGVQPAFRYHISQSGDHAATLADAQYAIQGTVIRVNRRIEIALSARPAKWLVESLAGHKDLDVREAITLRSDTPATLLAWLANDRYARIREAVAYNPSTPPALLEHLVQDRHYKVRLAVAQHPHAAEKILTRLAGDPAPEVRCAVALHPQATPVILATLDHDDDPEIRRALTSRQLGEAPLLFWRFMRPAWNSLSDSYTNAQKDRSDDTSDEPQERILSYFWHNEGQYGNDLALLLALSYPFISAEILGWNAASPFWVARYIVARHPNADQPILECLARDGNRFVRAAAREHLSMGDGEEAQGE